MKPINRKAFLKQMNSDGWVKSEGRKRAGHDIYEYLDGTHFAVPRHSEVSAGVVQQYCKLMKEKK